jgi:Domain of unknown function (DUF1905)
MTRQSSASTVVQADGGHVRIPIPFDPREAWGVSRWYYVQGTLNGTPFRGSMGARDGGFSFC